MSFSDLDIQCEYRSLVSDVAKNFYIPVLKESILYQRAVGFFSSSILSEIAEGIEYLAKNGGKIQLIASPRLQAQDVKAIEKGYELRDADAVHEIVKRALLRELLDPETSEEKKRLGLLVNLIASRTLDIKIALMKSKNTMAMYHEKMGIMEDQEGNRIAFSGSMNESGNSLTSNYETIDVFRSWISSFEAERAEMKAKAFTSIWRNEERQMEVLEFPEVKKAMIQKYKQPIEKPKDKGFQDEKVTVDEELVKDDEEQSTVEKGPKIPDSVNMRDYQLQAYQNWEKQNYCGIFDMATGTGKTYTALAAICKLYEKLNKNLAVIIVCPYQHLVEQWKSDIEFFGMDPIVCYSASAQKDWRERLKRNVRGFKFRAINHFCMVTTNATFSTEYVQRQLKELRGNVLLVVDEVHNLGSQNLQQALLSNAKYRLALSATIERHGDEEGTQVLYDYFGSKCIEYTLKDAIQNGMLTPYYYYPIVVSLSEDEREAYLELTRKIGRMVMVSSSGGKKKVRLSEQAKALLIKRARLVAAASEKIAALQKAITPYKEKNHMLVYCGATTMKDVDYIEGKPGSDDMRQIEVVTQLLGNQMGMRVARFTSEEDSQKRKQLIESFDQGTAIQALIAIRCLDEGVNIPSVDKAFILASSTNPKEYVQRRGRVLRLYPGKESAMIYDFVTLPISLEEVDQWSTEDLSAMKSLAQREVVRMIDFAQIAKNPFEIDSLIYQIKEAYGLKDEEIEEAEEDEWSI